VEIRRARPADAPAIAEVHVRSWQGAYPGLIPQDYLDALRPEDRVGWWRDALATTPWPVVLVAEEDGAVIGFASVSPTRDADDDSSTVGELQTIYLHPDAFGRGKGASLLHAALEVLRTAGFTEATLWALETNTRARRFYERHGFVNDGVTKRHDWIAFVATDVRYRITLA